MRWRKLLFLVLAVATLTATCFATVWHKHETSESAEALAQLPWRGNVMGMGRLPDSLPQHEIDELAELSRFSVKLAGKRIGTRRLSFAALEETYLRILIAQKTLTEQRAFELWRSLHGVEGFRTTLRKISSSNVAQRKGHMYELELAEAARLYKFQPRAVGKKFDDGVKRGRTDLDVWLKDGRINIFIQAKNYENVSFSSLPQFRADMNSLKALGRGMRVFALHNLPRNVHVRRALELAAEQRGVTLLYGKAEEIMKQLRGILAA